MVPQNFRMLFIRKLTDYYAMNNILSLNHFQIYLLVSFSNYEWIHKFGQCNTSAHLKHGNGNTL